MKSEWAVGFMALAAAATLQGCAVGLLKGAADAGSSSSGGAAPSSSSGGSSSALAADSAISTSVRSRLVANTALKGLNIGVDTHDGVVTLRGQVSKVEQKTAAEVTARSVKNVRFVQNLLTVR